MAALQRRRRQSSREGAAEPAEAPRRAHREDRKKPQLEETADQKLDRLLKEQRAARASSLPAEDDLAVRRLAMHPTAEGGEPQGEEEREVWHFNLDIMEGITMRQLASWPGLEAS